MSFQASTYAGDSTYPIDTTGDCVVGDEVSFERATFSGSFRNAKFAGYELVQGKVVAESYGRDKQQHTFTIETLDGSKIKIKGRNLYANGLWRKAWAGEGCRLLAAEEKHVRGAGARQAREIRLSSGA